MITRELENHLNQLEFSLHKYSFEMLGIQEAISLKQTFDVFKYELQTKNERVFTIKGNGPIGNIDTEQKMTKVSCLISKVLKEVQCLKKDDIDNKQYEAIATIELASSIILQLTTNTSRA